MTYKMTIELDGPEGVESKSFGGFTTIEQLDKMRETAKAMAPKGETMTITVDEE